MALVVADLADVINETIGATDKDGNPIATTPEMMTYAQAIIDTLQAGVLANAPGTVNATGAPGAPVTAGSATNGLLTLQSSVWLAVMTAGFPTAPTPKLSSEATASSGYIQSNAKVEFATGEINGTCTATPVTPGILAGGSGTGGEVGSLSGSPWSSAVAGAIGFANTPLAQDIYAAIVEYVQDNAEGTYLPFSVVGVFPPAGGSMTVGAGIGGTIS